MLYILGGSSRSGKSIIARRFVAEKQIPFFGIDFLITTLQEIPELGIHHGDQYEIKAERIWPLIKPMLLHLASEEPKYLIEGDGILPKHINELSKENPEKVKACFVGFCDISPEEKLKIARDKGGNQDDWTKKYSDEEMIGFIKGMIDYSNYLKRECNKYSIKYFDCSQNFPTFLDQVFDYLAPSS